MRKIIMAAALVVATTSLAFAQDGAGGKGAGGQVKSSPPASVPAMRRGDDMAPSMSQGASMTQPMHHKKSKKHHSM